MREPIPVPTSTISSPLDKLIFASTNGRNEAVIKNIERNLPVLLNMGNTWQVMRAKDPY
jgi:hypothetical protein